MLKEFLIALAVVAAIVLGAQRIETEMQCREPVGSFEPGPLLVKICVKLNSWI